MTEPTATIETTAEGTRRRRRPQPAPAGRHRGGAGRAPLPAWAPMAGAVVVGLAVAAPLLRTARQSHVHLRPGEEIAMRIRPRAA